jgi:DNA-binding transcriptional ArsR family regulator
MMETLTRPEVGTPVLTETDHVVTDLFQVLASPIRLAVLRLLLQGERCVCDLLDDLGIAQPRLSNHLACLRNCGLVCTRRQGNFVYYTIADPRVAEIVHLGDDLAAANAEELERCPAVSTRAAVG